MKFLSGAFEVKDARNATPRALSGRLSSPFASFGGAVNGRWDIEHAVLHGYEKVIWVFRCVDAIASNGAGIPIIVREYDDVDGTIVQDPAIHRLFNRRPNHYETSQQLRYRLISQLLLSRQGAFVEIVRNRQGRPIQAHLLPPSSVTPIRDAQTYVSGYRVKSLEGGYQDLKPDQVIWVRVKPHPTDPYAQMTPMVASGLAADTDFLARIYNRNFLANDGRPATLVNVRGNLSPDDASELKRRFSGGVVSAGSTTVMESDGIDVQDMSANPRDAMYVESIAGSKSDLLLAFGVAESVLGNASGRTFDNADAEFENFWTVTMLPLLDAIGASFDGLTAGGLEDNLVVTHDYSKIDVLQRRSRERHDKYMAEVQAGTMTIDQYLIAIGRQPFNVPGTSVLWLPAGKIPVGQDDATTDAAQALQQVGMGAPIPGNPSINSGFADPNNPQGGNTQQITQQQRQLANIQAARALQLAGNNQKELMPPFPTAPQIEGKSHPILELKALSHPYEADRKGSEAEISAVLSAWSRRQENAIVERLGNTKTRQGTRHWEGEGAGVKALDTRKVVDTNKWAEELINDLDDVLKPLAEKHAVKLARELQRAGVVDRMLRNGKGNSTGKSAIAKIMGSSSDYKDAPTELAKNMIRDSAVRQTEKVVDLIKQMDKDGHSIDQIKRKVRDTIGTRSSWKKGLSTAVTTTIIEGARNSVLNQCKDFVARKWNTMEDEKVRPSHRKADGQTRTGGKPFIVGDYPLMYPGDITAPIHETANCRCWLTWSPTVMKNGKPVMKKKELALA